MTGRHRPMTSRSVLLFPKPRGNKEFYALVGDIVGRKSFSMVPITIIFLLCCSMCLRVGLTVEEFPRRTSVARRFPL